MKRRFVNFGAFQFLALFAWLSIHAASAADPARFIPEILALRDGAPIPQSIIERYDSRSIGESIAWRIHLRDEMEGKATKGDNVQYDMMNESDILLHFNMGDFDSIQKQGFLNQHQTWTSNGMFDPTRRNKMDEKLMGISLGEYPGDKTHATHLVRPKYAALRYNGLEDVGDRSAIEADQYGEVIAVLKPEVKRRATWTTSDSLNDGEHLPLHRLRQRLQGTFHRKTIKRDDVNSYSEAQIFGALELADVAYFMVVDDFGGKLLERLEQAGIPIYRRQTLSRHGRTDYHRGELLYAGDPAKLIAYEALLERSVQGFEGDAQGGCRTDYRQLNEHPAS